MSAPPTHADDARIGIGSERRAEAGGLGGCQLQVGIEGGGIIRSVREGG